MIGHMQTTADFMTKDLTRSLLGIARGFELVEAGADEAGAYSEHWRCVVSDAEAFTAFCLDHAQIIQHSLEESA